MDHELGQELGQEPEERRWWTAVGQAGRAVAPYWFVAAGIVLGLGGIIQDKPLAGACGAVAGVTAGLLERQRASVYRKQALAMRARLRRHRAKAAATEAELRETISTLQTEIWEHRMFSLITANLASARAVTASGEETVPVDGELLDTGSLDVVEPEIEITTPAELEREPGEPAAIEAQVIQLHEAREVSELAEEPTAQAG